AVEERVQRLKSLCLDAPDPVIYIEPFGYDQPLGAIQSHNNTGLDASHPLARTLMAMAQEFLESDKQVLLIVGDPSSGKTVFVRQLERELWGEYTGSDDPIPILVNLPEFGNTATDVLGQVLKSKGFHSEHTQLLRRNKRQFILICDGYDEAQVQGNIYNQNRFNRDGQWIVKLIIVCRSDKIGRDSDSRFQLEVDNRYSPKKLDQFQRVAIASFTLRQIRGYIERYVEKQLQVVVQQSFGVGQDVVQHRPSEVPLTSESSRVWNVQHYMERLADIPNLMELVKNPYILSFIMELLPKTMSSTEQQTLGRLTEYGFRTACMEYLKNLVVEIFTKQGGGPVVEYSYLRHKNTSPWKAKFFGPDPETRLLQESVPLINSGSFYRFAHPSLLQYLYSLAVFDPNGCDDGDSGDYGNSGNGNPTGGCILSSSNLEDLKRDKQGLVSTSSPGSLKERGQALEREQTLGKGRHWRKDTSWELSTLQIA
ncbi:hypothetical protein BG015_004604, partial [Linnemannia schmuckeri]